MPHEPRSDSRRARPDADKGLRERLERRQRQYQVDSFRDHMTAEQLTLLIRAGELIWAGMWEAQ